MEAISALADVPPATVYRLFSSKHGILESLLDVAVVGDAEDVPLADRPQVRAVLAERDPQERLAGFVTIAARVNAGIAPLHRVLVSAAGTDAHAAALLDGLTRRRQEGQRLIARSLARAGALRPGLHERDAADIVHALLSPELYGLLVIDRGWTTGQYQPWLAETLVDQLLPRAPATP